MDPWLVRLSQWPSHAVAAADFWSANNVAEDLQRESRRTSSASGTSSTSTDKVLGRAASQIATLLKGKHKAIYTPSIDTGDHVIVINAAKVKVTGTKETAKLYHRHPRAGFPGALKTTNLAKLRERHPEDIVINAVRRMLPAQRAGPADDDQAQGLRRRQAPARGPEARPRAGRGVSPSQLDEETTKMAITDRRVSTPPAAARRPPRACGSSPAAATMIVNGRTHRRVLRARDVEDGHQPAARRSSSRRARST